LRQALGSRQARTVVITSALRAEGKTTTACNLALALASLSGTDRIALVDLDLRRPAVAGVFGWDPSPGIDRVLLREAPLAAARVATDENGLELFGVEQRRVDAHEMLSLDALPTTLQELATRYELVIIDSPPALLVPDTALLLQHLAAYVAVSRAGTTRLAAFRAMIEQLGRGKLVGTFLNEVPQPRHLTEYGYYLAESEKE
jgi:Mrp family chromosome partitioning ATPase